VFQGSEGLLKPCVAKYEGRRDRPTTMWSHICLAKHCKFSESRRREKGVCAYRSGPACARTSIATRARAMRSVKSVSALQATARSEREIEAPGSEGMEGMRFMERAMRRAALAWAW